jgi:DNA-binding transcriptional regulator YdaS (Cro superfamily)
MKRKKITDIGTNELANFLNISASFASQIKNGVRKLPPKDCQRVSERFFIPLHDLRPDIFKKIKKEVKK